MASDGSESQSLIMYMYFLLQILKVLHVSVDATTGPHVSITITSLPHHMSRHCNFTCRSNSTFLSTSSDNIIWESEYVLSPVITGVPYGYVVSCSVMDQTFTAMGSFTPGVYISYAHNIKC